MCRAQKAALNQMTADLGRELQPQGIAVVGIWPGLVTTENVLSHAAMIDLSRAESPRFSGRAVVALATDPQVMDKTGRSLVVQELATEYGFTDPDRA